MTKELITVLVFFGVIALCVIWQVVDNVIFIRRLRKEKDKYNNLLKNLREKPIIPSEKVSLSVIEARQYVPAEQFLRLPSEDIERDTERRLAVKIGEEIVKACGVRKGYNDEYQTYCFRVAVEVTSRSLKKEGENGT